MLLVIADRMLLRMWPYIVFGVMAVVGMLAMDYFGGLWVVVASAAVGFATAITFRLTPVASSLLTLPLI